MKSAKNIKAHTGNGRDTDKGRTGPAQTAAHACKIGSRAALAGALAAALVASQVPASLIAAAADDADADTATQASAASAKKSASKKSIAKATVKLSKKKYAYNGKTRKPKVTVTWKGKTLKKGKAYSVTYQKWRSGGWYRDDDGVMRQRAGKWVKATKAKLKTAGTFRVVVKGTGRWSGKVTRKYRVVKKTASSSSATSSSTSSSSASATAAKAKAASLAATAVISHVYDQEGSMGTKVTLTWEAVEGADGYDIYSTHGEWDYWKDHGTTTGTSGVYSTGNIYETTTFKVRAYVECGDEKYYGDFGETYTFEQSEGCEHPDGCINYGSLQKVTTLDYGIAYGCGYYLSFYNENYETLERAHRNTCTLSAHGSSCNFIYYETEFNHACAYCNYQETATDGRLLTFTSEYLVFAQGKQWTEEGCELKSRSPTCSMCANKDD